MRLATGVLGATFGYHSPAIFLRTPPTRSPLPPTHPPYSLPATSYALPLHAPRYPPTHSPYRLLAILLLRCYDVSGTDGGHAGPVGVWPRGWRGGRWLAPLQPLSSQPGAEWAVVGCRMGAEWAAVQYRMGCC
eukprot:2860638-Rhodomonas_salina.1